ncbi:MAG TPA: serine hydrolase domain-containing protein [Acetobacteraceae bacterium]|jgi:CubicO group peptidase (beta-lactamase class C family)
MTVQSRIDSALRNAQAAQAVPGFVALATTAGATIYQGAFGLRDLSGQAPMQLDTVFWLASMTKALTSFGAMQLVEQGRLSLDAPIADTLPALAAPQVLEGFDAAGAPMLRPARDAITLRHLLTHTAGYGYGTWNPELGRYQEQTGVAPAPTNWTEAERVVLLFDPGTRWNYGINTDLVGKAVEAASGQSLDAYLRDHVLEPLGMQDTAFMLTQEQQARRARMHARQADSTLLPIDYAAGDALPFCLGGGRLCSTGPDYLRFLCMILGGGSLDGVRLLRPETVAEMQRNHIGDLEVTTLRSAVPATSNDANLFPGMSQKWGLGFLINTAAGPAGRSAGSLAWAGLANTYYWIDPARGVAGLILMQIMPFADPGALSMLAAFETAFYAELN